MILTPFTSVKAERGMTGLPQNRVLQLLIELKAAYHGFTWESALWAECGHRRRPYRALVLFGLSVRTRDALLVQMCRRFFSRFPDADALSESAQFLADGAEDIIRAGQFPLVSSIADTLAEGVPRSREELLRINGVGEKISECVMAYGWGEDALPLDSNCIRVLARVFGLPGLLPPEAGRAGRNPAPLRERLKYIYLMDLQRFADSAIAMVDIHEILRLHGQVCCARTPDCSRCPVSGCLSRREPWDGSKSVNVPADVWDDWRELINEPATV